MSVYWAHNFFVCLFVRLLIFVVCKLYLSVVIRLSLKIEPASSTPRATASREDLVGMVKGNP